MVPQALSCITFHVRLKRMCILLLGMECLLGIFSPGLGSDEPERMTLGQSFARTDEFISAVKPFYRSRNKELRVYSQQSTYGVNT